MSPELTAALLPEPAPGLLELAPLVPGGLLLSEDSAWKAWEMRSAARNDGASVGFCETACSAWTCSREGMPRFNPTTTANHPRMTSTEHRRMRCAIVGRESALGDCSCGLQETRDEGTHFVGRGFFLISRHRPPRCGSRYPSFRLAPQYFRCLPPQRLGTQASTEGRRPHVLGYRFRRSS